MRELPHMRTTTTTYAASGRVKRMDRGQSRIGVFPRSPAPRVRRDVAASRIPIALQEAEDIVGLGRIYACILSKSRGECRALAQRAVLDCGSEEGRRLNLFPEVCPSDQTILSLH